MKHLLCGLFVLALVAASQAADPPNPLQGIDSLRVVVEYLPEEAASINLTDTAIQDTMLAALHQNHIPLTSDRGTIHVLYVLLYLKNNDDQILYHVDLNMYEYMPNIRINTYVPARLWNEAWLGTAPMEESRDAILHEVKLLTESFAIAHYFANAR